jgi:hypothetical protein
MSMHFMKGIFLCKGLYYLRIGMYMYMKETPDEDAQVPKKKMKS